MANTKQHAGLDMQGNQVLGLPGSTADGEAVRHEQLVAEETARTDADAALDTRLDVVEATLPNKRNLTDNDYNGARLTEVGTPTLADDAATKGYVDTAVAGATITVQDEGISNTPNRNVLDLVQSAEIDPTVTDTTTGTPRKLLSWALRVASIAYNRLVPSAGYTTLGNATGVSGAVGPIGPAGTDTVHSRSGSGDLGWTKVLTPMINDLAVTGAKIANNTITSGKVAANTLALDRLVTITDNNVLGRIGTGTTGSVGQYPTTEIYTTFPATPTSTGLQGQRAIDGFTWAECTATNTWRFGRFDAVTTVNTTPDTLTRASASNMIYTLTGTTTLPAANAVPGGWWVRVIARGASVSRTIQPAGSDTIAGTAVAIVASGPDDGYMLISDGVSNWTVMNI